MTNRRAVLVGALGVMLGALPTGSLGAQRAGGTPAAGPSVETFYTQLRLDSDGPSLNASGVGGRVMWSASALPGALDWLGGRTSLGVYGSYTPAHTFAQGLEFSTIGVGGVADVRPLAAPLGGRVDPFLSLGAGYLNTRVDVAVAPAPSPLLADSHVAFALTPGVGARVTLMPHLALQGDVRDLMTFEGGTRNNIGLGAGLRFAF